MAIKDCNTFEKWLIKQGAEVLAPTNPYELARFRAMSATHIVYSNAKGKISANGFARLCYDTFLKNGTLDMGIVKFKRNNTSTKKAALLRRDGRDCFYCGLEMPNEDITAEHLIARDKGGPNKLENMALAHKRCNGKADNLPFMEKIKLRDKIRADMLVAA
jgi:hypothetical protein